MDISGPERAAIMIMYLDRKVAQSLLRKMGDEEIRQIGMAMSRIDQIAPNVIEEVVRQFVKDLSESAAVPSTGPEFISDVLPGLIDEDRQRNIIPMLRRRVDKSFEQFIAARPPSTVAALLRDERPQAQAVALALMGHDNAGRVLRFLQEDEQLEITMRMARLKQIPGELADDVISALKAALGNPDDPLEVGGVDHTARILASMPRSKREPILYAIEDEDYNLADTLNRRLVTFEDLVHLNGRSVQVLLKSVEREDLLVALKTADPTIRDLFLANVSKRARQDMIEEMEIMESPSRARIKKAQEAIVAAAIKLKDEGSITLQVGGGEEEEEES